MGSSWSNAAWRLSCAPSAPDLKTCVHFFLSDPLKLILQTPLSRLPATSPKPLTSALSQFSSFLNSLDVLSSPRLALLTSNTLAETIHRQALRKISEAYAEVCDLVLDKKEGYEFGETMIRRGREEVAVALGVGAGEG